MRLRALAPAKLNLCLFLGPTREDGRHELVTVFESLSLADTVSLAVSEGGEDEVVCPGVEGPNLAAAALAGLRGAGWSAPAVRLDIDKRIPVAAGLGGGSADAAAVLRLADALEPLESGLAERVARRLGADVPSQLDPGLYLGTGAGEMLQPLPEPASHAVVILPQAFPLSTAQVYAEADRLGLPRSQEELRRRQTGLLEHGVDDLLINDLEPAARSLAPPVGEALETLRAAGADTALVCGSGPTTAGIVWGPDAAVRAQALADDFAVRGVTAWSAHPVGRDFGRPDSPVSA